MTTTNVRRLFVIGITCAAIAALPVETEAKHHGSTSGVAKAKGGKTGGRTAGHNARKKRAYAAKAKKPSGGAGTRQGSRNANRKRLRKNKGKKLPAANPKRTSVNIDWANLNKPATAGERGNLAAQPLVKLKDAIQATKRRSAEASNRKKGLWTPLSSAVLDAVPAPAPPPRRKRRPTRKTQN